MFTCSEVECLGACVNAPMVQVNDDFVEDLTYENFAGVLRRLKNGGDLPAGSLAGRYSSEPEDGARTLTDVPAPVPFDPAAVYGMAGAVIAASEPAGPGADRPAALDGPRGGKADALTRIKGLGPKIENALHAIGIFQFRPDRRLDAGREAVGRRRTETGRPDRARRLGPAGRGAGRSGGGRRLMLQDRDRISHQPIRLRRLGPRRRAPARRLGPDGLVPGAGPAPGSASRSRNRACAAGAAPAFRPGSNGPSCRRTTSATAARTIWSSTPTNPSPAPARTGTSCATIRTSWSRAA